jgi:hypothetical protein
MCHLEQMRNKDEHFRCCYTRNVVSVVAWLKERVWKLRRARKGISEEGKGLQCVAEADAEDTLLNIFKWKMYGKGAISEDLA